MRDFKIDNKGTGTIFHNKFLETLTKTHFAAPVIIFYVVGMVSVVYGLTSYRVSLLQTVLLFPAGMILFSLVEYLMHRFLFHFHAETEEQKELQYKIHGVHHEFPKDKDRLVMPLPLSLALSFVFFVLFYFTCGIYTFTLYGGFVAGYSTYLMIHYSIHRYRPPKNFLRYLWTHHSLHHYYGDTSAFSVSFPVWDYVFRTMPAHSKKKNKEPLHESIPQ